MTPGRLVDHDDRTLLHLPMGSGRPSEEQPALLGISATLPAGRDPLSATGEEAPRPTRARGSVVGRYVILSLLGTGGMGAVYAAHDPELDRKVALKLLHPRRGRDRGAPRRSAGAGPRSPSCSSPPSS